MSKIPDLVGQPLTAEMSTARGEETVTGNTVHSNSNHSDGDITYRTTSDRLCAGTQIRNLDKALLAPKGQSYGAATTILSVVEIITRNKCILTALVTILNEDCEQFGAPDCTAQKMVSITL